MFDKLKKAAGTAMNLAGKAKETYDYANASKSQRKRMKQEKARKKAAQHNDQWVEMPCPTCGRKLKINSVYCGQWRKCNICSNDFEVPLYADYLASKPPEPEKPTVEESPKSPDTSDYHDLESAILYFNEKAEKIRDLPVSEDEKEMLLMKLQEKRERVLDDFI